MPIDASLERRKARWLVQAAVCAGAVIAFAVATGCDRPPEPSEDQEISTAAMTEDEFVAHMAALTVAVEDGLSGEEARDRAAELGGALYTRDEIEEFADILRADAERWAAVSDRIDRKIAEIRSTGAAGRVRPGETDGSGESGRAATGESRDAGEPAELAGTGRDTGS